MGKYIEGNLDNFPQVRFLKKFLIGHPGIIAGGCFRAIFANEEIHDVDMFFRSREDYEAAVAYFSQNEGYAVSYSNQKVQAFVHKESKIRIECVRSIFGNPADILDQFDFTIAKFAYETKAEPGTDISGDAIWEYTDVILYHSQFFEHLMFKRLVVDENMPFPISTFNRTYKYARSGYLPCRETKLKIVKAIFEMEEPPEEDDFAKAFYEGHD